ncbi:response regulator [Paenibacillus qinlingensis]|uniref:Two-component system response regulator YesN n=1 Tax=Paenibacillus qinlingensis TaxID=1837343 RepID=A0ABU1P4P5_9BACL|nr:response regulator [Paenibacillus qinlingensis]MDR6554725.1 two-component system response regulator YesN [Paenibacillus qinlingensis]
MYTIIMVDDEDEVREGIKKKTNWEACGFQLVGDYDNGRDAYEAVERLQPDVVITDINMPFMDGLQLTERIVAKYRTIKVVIVTGYEDFDYAKQAIKLKVKDYLLKPINSAEFTEFLQKLCLELDEERKQREDITFLRHQFQESMPLLRERFLERLVTSGMRKEEIERKLPMFGLDLESSGPRHTVLALDIDDFGRELYSDQVAEEELLRFAAYNILHEIVEKEHGGAVFRTRDDKLVGLVSGAEERVEVVSQTLAEQARYSIEKYLGMTVTVGISRMCEGLQELPKAFQEALTALDYRFMLGNNRIIAIGDMEFGSSQDNTSYLRTEKRLIAAIKIGEKTAITNTLQEWIDDLKKSACPMESCYGKLHKLLVALMNAGVETGVDGEDVLGDHSFMELYTRKTLDDVRLWLEAICVAFVDRLAEKRTHVSGAQLESAVAYIHEHYADEQLSLQHVCNHIYMSMSYFSALFKPYTGETFIEYVTRYRLEKAKEMLATTQLKTYELAAKVGYGDPQYFSVIFKRHTGMTPKEFRAANKAGLNV